MVVKLATLEVQFDHGLKDWLPWKSNLIMNYIGLARLEIQFDHGLLD